MSSASARPRRDHPQPPAVYLDPGREIRVADAGEQGDFQLPQGDQLSGAGLSGCGGSCVGSGRRGRGFCVFGRVTRLCLCDDPSGYREGVEPEVLLRHEEQKVAGDGWVFSALSGDFWAGYGLKCKKRI